MNVDLRIILSVLTNFVHEVLVKIQGKQYQIWRAVGQDDEVVDVFFLQARRDGKAAMCSFKRLAKTHGGEPRRVVANKLRRHGVAHRELFPGTIHDTPIIDRSSHANLSV